MENIEVNTDIMQGERKLGKFWFSLTFTEFEELQFLLYQFGQSLKVGTIGVKDTNGNYNKNFTIQTELI